MAITKEFHGTNYSDAFINFTLHFTCNIITGFSLEL